MEKSGVGTLNSGVIGYNNPGIIHLAGYAGGGSWEIVRSLNGRNSIELGWGVVWRGAAVPLWRNLSIKQPTSILSCQGL